MRQQVILGHRDVVRRDRGRGRHAPTGSVRSSIVASQAELHARYGGVVPEVASRRHLELIGPVIREALDEAERRARRASPGSASRAGRA